jgi:hypothetical protein
MQVQIPANLIIFRTPALVATRQDIFRWNWRETETFDRGRRHSEQHRFLREPAVALRLRYRAGGRAGEPGRFARQGGNREASDARIPLDLAGRRACGAERCGLPVRPRLGERRGSVADLRAEGVPRPRASCELRSISRLGPYLRCRKRNSFCDCFKFVQPRDLNILASAVGCKTVGSAGIWYETLSTRITCMFSSTMVNLAGLKTQILL